MFIYRYLQNPLLILASLVVMSFAGVGVKYMDPLFSYFTRWVFLAALIGYLILRNRIFLSLKGTSGFILVLFVGWCFLTVFWSEAQTLSLFKVTAFAACVIGCTSVGVLWAKRRQYHEALFVFVPVSLLALFAAVFGVLAGDSAIVSTGSLNLYRGLTNNSNLMGILIIMAWPVALWSFEVARRRGGNRTIAVAIVLLMVTVLLATNARSSIAAVGITTAVYLFGAGFSRYGWILLMAILFGLGTYILNPELIEKIEERYIYKSQESSGVESIFASREDQMDLSLRKAKEGGFVGGGFGVAIGMTRLNEFSAFSASRNREKGSSALAVLEEIGVVGFFLYVLVLLMTVLRPIRAARRTKDYDLSILLYLVAGTLLGLIFNSQFEAWWLAPGGAATPYYWCLTGVALGLSARVSREELLSRKREAGALNDIKKTVR